MAVQISGNDITVPRDTTVTRNLTVGGVLTYEDVTNVDSVGLITARSGVKVTSGDIAMDTAGNITLGDSGSSSDDRIVLGASSDLSIYHDGSHSRIDETGTGNLMIQSDNAVFIKKGTSEDIARFNVDGAVELLYDSSLKFETSSSGVTVTGKITTSGGSSGSTVFNEDGADVDFRVEGDTQASLFKVDAGNDRVGIGESTPTVVFHATQFNHAFADSTSSLATVPTKSLARFIGSNNSSASLFIGNESTGAKSYLQGCNETGNGSIDILLNPFGAKASTKS